MKKLRILDVGRRAHQDPSSERWRQGTKKPLQKLQRQVDAAGIIPCERALERAMTGFVPKKFYWSTNTKDHENQAARSPQSPIPDARSRGPSLERVAASY